MDHFGFFQALFDLLLDWSQLSGTAFDQVTHRALAHLDSQQVAHDLTGTGQWQQLLLCQIHGNGSDDGSVLEWGLRFFGKGGHRDVVALGTLFVLGLVLLHEHMRRRDIDHLSPFPTARRNRSQVLLARFTLLDLLEGHLIGSRRPLQGRPRMSWLPACFLLTLLAQTLGLAHKAVRRGGQVAIVAI